MWEIRVVTVGKIKEPGALALAQTYSKRVCGEWRLALDAVSASKRPEPAAKRREETASLLARVPNGARAVALDPEGVSYDTARFSSFLGGLKDRGEAVCFLVGGAYGFDKAALGSTAKISLSAMTMAHELAAVVLCEQIYRAFTLCTGRPYSK
ncbi:MAG: 23S rRNA (pseudouridine(1915)-N(3))-methyltransferase RlmH [Acidobacteria bacterium]|nr:23S rRNA (pseudouridine(1915)-N(3))-methyltransferase RlmH [Acidobacteriota bacterium]